MPELHFKGKEFVYNYHLSVPYCPLVPNAKKSIGEADLSGSLIIHGDNLVALKALLPHYAGGVDVAYIDPPYNTGNESWRYNDNVNSPMMREWLASNPVNKDDMLRHDKWLALMYPRLRLLHELLADHGVIFVSIDDNELYHLRKILDEIFGDVNWIGTIVWKNVTDNNPTNVSVEHEYIVCFAKNRERIEPEWKSALSDVKAKLVEVGKQFVKKYPDWKERQEAYTEWFRDNKQFLWPLDRYKYIDDGGIYTGSQSVHNPGREGYRYNVLHPRTKKPCKEPLMGYRFPQETMQQILKDGKVLFGDDHNKIIELKVYAHEYEDKLPSVIELDGRIGAYELRNLFPDEKKVFDNPKPSALLLQLLSFTAKSDAIVLDSFAGSGTTAHAVLALNKQDNGKRKFILVEGENYADELTAERVRRVTKGVVGSKDDTIKKGIGGSFTYTTLGPAVDLDHILTGQSLPEFKSLGAWLFHTATGEALNAKAVNEKTWFLGESTGFFVWLVYKPDLDFLKSRDAALTLELAERIGKMKDIKGTNKRHLVFAPAKYVTNKMLLPLGVEHAPLPFALYRVEKS